LFSAVFPENTGRLANEGRVVDKANIRVKARWHHSTTVAEWAASIAASLGLSPTERRRARRVALLHDLGIAAVPLAVATKEGRLSEAEDEQLRLHSYYTERLLQRVPPFRDMAAEASADHEWLNGEGYHHHWAGEGIPLTGRILAVADASVTLERQRGRAMEPTELLAALRPMAGAQLDPYCCEALASPQGAPRSAKQDKLGVSCRTSAVVYAVQHGLA
jgi:HD-GYP domain-containing protein (c-di-GMP phosphodiesterase class II)